MAELRLRGSPPTRCAMFLNAASSAVAVYVVAPVSVGLLEFPALVDLVTLAGMAGRVRVRRWGLEPQDSWHGAKIMQCRGVSFARRMGPEVRHDLGTT